MRRHRELLKEMKKIAKETELIRARNEAEQYETYLQLIVSLHKDCADSWDWKACADAPQPEPRVAVGGREAAARKAAEAYVPGFFEKLFGGAKVTKAQLEKLIAEGADADEHERQEIAGQNREVQTLWELRRQIGAGVVAHSPDAYRRALDHAAPFEELVAYGAQVSVTSAEPDVIAFSCDAVDKELVPTEEVKLTAGGKLTSKEMPLGKYYPLYQDYLASATLRVAREAFALLPVTRVIVNSGRTQTNTSTGHEEPVTLLAVHFTRGALERLNFAAIDPSDSMKNFQHRMKFKKSAGFEPVEPITAEEQWVTTG